MAITKESGHPYAFRIRFHSEPARQYKMPEVRVDLEGGGPQLRGLNRDDKQLNSEFALYQAGFDRAEDASFAGDRWFDAILIAGLRLGVGFDLGRFPRGGFRFFNSFLQDLSKQEGAPVRPSVHGLDVFEEPGGTKFLAGGTPRAYVTAPIEPLMTELQSGLPASPIPPKGRLALELWSVSRFEASARMRFLVLVSAVEVLAKRQKQSAVIVRTIDRWIGMLSSPRMRETLGNRVRDLRRQSIGEACRDLVRERLDDAAVDAFRDLYKKRSKLLHDGKVDGTDFMNEAAGADNLVRKLLLAEFTPRMSGSSTPP